MTTSDFFPSGKWVSYFSKQYKALALSQGEEVLVEDIMQFRTGKLPAGKTRLKIWQEYGSLFLEVHCQEPDPAQIRANISANGMAVWEDDLLEIFFGAIEPVPWQLQLAVGAGGGRFDSQGTYNLWDARCILLADGWQARIQISLDMLRLQNLSTGFNICRQSVARQEFSSWAALETAFHEVENYGELFFCDYETAYFAKTGQEPEKNLTRRCFEKALTELAVSSEQVAHGPFLSNPAYDAMTITWTTTGMAAAMLEYKKEGEEEWERIPIDRENGILCRNSKLHVAHLSGLEASTRYQYRLVNWSALLTKRVLFPPQEPLTFRTLSVAPKPFSFAVCSDIHSNGLVLKKLMALPEVCKTDFWVNLGDMLSRMSGPDAFYTGFLDDQSQVYAKEKPLVFVRGNHEQVGIFAGEYLRILPHPTGKTYYAFQQGAVFFLVLDAGDDHADDPEGLRDNASLLEEERLWLEQIVAGEHYRKAAFRIAFLHMPPYNDEYDSQAALQILSAIPATAPLSLLLCGHVHRYFRMPPFSGKCHCFGKPEIPSMKNTPVLPYTVVANDTDTLTLVRVDAEKLSIKVLGCDGRTIEEFSVEKAGV
ncbi:MAG: metallophosphoesterase [Lentisphaeria bacterium]